MQQIKDEVISHGMAFIQSGPPVGKKRETSHEEEGRKNNSRKLTKRLAITK